jgi:gluconate 2-dehydrogenase gamma chain
MNVGHQTRRDFLSGSSRTATAGWLALQLPWLAALAGCARDDAATGGAFTHLSPAEARTMRALAAQILPSDDEVPGAEEAGAVYFVDRALGMPFFADKVSLIRSGLADLDARAKAFDAHGGFASLSGSQQVAILQRIEGDPFFAAARTLVVIGTLADPSYGGNRDAAGWTMIGMQHQPSYAAPFGWYDAQPTNGASHAA